MINEKRKGNEREKRKKRYQVYESEKHQFRAVGRIGEFEKEVSKRFNYRGNCSSQLIEIVSHCLHKSAQQNC